jgi:uncharacterized protein (TIGR02611 family)
MFIKTLKMAKRVVIVVIGFTVLLVGIIMIVAPGPAILVIPAGLALLATEFIWARKLLKRFKTEGARFRDLLFGKKKDAQPTDPEKKP